MKIFLKLRANVELAGDVSLAKREACFFLEDVEDVTVSNSSNKPAHFYTNCRKHDIVGFQGNLRKHIALQEIVLKTSFVQEIWTTKLDSNSRGKVYVNEFVTESKKHYCLLPLFACGELLSSMKSNSISENDISLLGQYLVGESKDEKLKKLVYKASTSSPHVHGLHKYKAKFFPRMIRSLIVTELSNSHGIILDPFVGSGTTLIESSFLGYNSIGVDIDSLSCLISEAKVLALNIKTSEVQKERLKFEKVSPSGKKISYQFPSWISRKFERDNTLVEKENFQNQIIKLTSQLTKLNGSKKLFQTAISDALSRKFNIRMMGTGVGRFALEIQKQDIEKIVVGNIDYTIKAIQIADLLKKAYSLSLNNAQIINGNATDLPLKNKSIDLVLTSPPYLPASSGREDYLIGKSVSITALGLMSEQMIKMAENSSVGSMNSALVKKVDELPQSIIKLYEWLKNDELRKIKAEPTLHYYLNLKKSLEECYRTLKTEGRVIYIIGKESVFYSFKSREVLYRVECDKIFHELALSAGFKVKESIDVELDKKNKNARPRSLDSYYESVVILTK